MEYEELKKNVLSLNPPGKISQKNKKIILNLPNENPVSLSSIEEAQNHLSNYLRRQSLAKKNDIIKQRIKNLEEDFL